MPIRFENGFYRVHDFAHVSGLYIESERLIECLDEIKNHKIKGVMGSPAFGFREDNLDFLSDMPWVEVIWFPDTSLKNIDAVYSLENLKYFGVHTKRPAIDFSKFKKLELAVIFPKAKDTGLASLTSLDTLHFWRYSPKSKDFTALEIPKSVTELQINWANPDSLEGLPNLPNLKRLEVHRCRNLITLGELGTKFPNLEHLVIDACGRVTEEEGLKAVKTIKKLGHASIQRVVYE